MDIESLRRNVKTILKDFFDRHWIMILAVLVLVLSCYMYLFTYSSMLFPFMIVSMWYISAVTFSNMKQPKMRHIISNIFRKKNEKEFNILRVYTNDEHFEKRMADPEYLETQSIDYEVKKINLSKDIPSQIPYYIDRDYRYCYHVLIDKKNQMYIASSYET